MSKICCNSRQINDQKAWIYIYLFYFMEPQMVDEEQLVNNHTPSDQPRQNKQIEQSIVDKKKPGPVLVARRPGRPSLRGRGRFAHVEAGKIYDHDKDEDYQIVRARSQNRNIGGHEQSNLEGFIRIIDYLKKIDCDEASLHNKMNPYNLLTPTCFWYIISAEYFSFDFFNNRNPNDAAIEILRKAQKTFIVLPQRIVKPLRIQGELQFETPQLRQASLPITDRLTNLIRAPMSINADGIQKSTFVTNISEDDLFRSSTRAIIYNYLKKKINTNQKWSTLLKPMLSNLQDLPSKQMQYFVMNIEDEQKDKNMILSTQMLYRQKRKINPQSSANNKCSAETQKKSTVPTNNKKSKQLKTKNKSKKNKKSPNTNNNSTRNQDDIFHESDEDDARQQVHEDDDAIMEDDEQQNNEAQQNDGNNDVVDLNMNNDKQSVDNKYIGVQQNGIQIIDGNNQKTGKQLKQQQQYANIQIQQQQQHCIQQQQQQQQQHQYQPQPQQQQQQQQQQQDDDPQNINHNNISQKNQQYQQQYNQQLTGKNKTIRKGNLEKLNKIYNEDDVLLDSILHLPLDHVISLLQASLIPAQLPAIVKDALSMPKYDPLDLVYQTHPEQEKFLQYMKDRQQKIYLDKLRHGEDKLEQKQRETQVEDAKCQVCTDGDYTDDNLIVFCSMCGISVHQRCVGLNKVPAQNWICQVCMAFGPAGCNVPCPLCNVKGGALKRTSIHINQPIFKDTNPPFHEYSKSCPFVKQKQQYIANTLQQNAQPEPYYDYFAKSSYNNDLPTCHYIWVHYVCAIWVPECYFQQKNGAINIKGIQNIDKKRFKQKCLMCQQTRTGACVKCDNSNCTKYYHPECARKKKVYMQQLNLDKLRYLIFCEAHEPLKVKRKIQIKKKKSRDQIVKFCRGIQKYVETYKIAPINFKLMKSIGFLDKIDRNFDGKDRNKGHDRQNQELKVILKVERNTDEDFIKDVIETLTKTNLITVNLIKIDKNSYRVEQVVKPSKREMRKSLNRIEQFWKQFNNGQTPQVNLKNFNNIMRQNFYLKQKIQNFINYGEIKQVKPQNIDKKPVISTPGKKGTVGRRRKIIRQTVIEQEGGIFCVCRKPYEGEFDMFECQVCNQWYHHECIGFIGSEKDAETLDFHCMKCMKYETQQARNARLDQCGRFFSVDSLFLNYRPPTPSLQSQEEDNDVNIAQLRQNYMQDHGKNEVNQKQSLDKISLSKQQQRIQRQDKNHLGSRTKILAILDKPFLVQGPFPRQNDEQFYEQKRTKKGFTSNQITNMVNGQYPSQKQYNKLYLSSNVMQMEPVSFKGQFIENRVNGIHYNQAGNSNLQFLGNLNPHNAHDANLQTPPIKQNQNIGVHFKQNFNSINTNNLTKNLNTHNVENRIQQPEQNRACYKQLKKNPIQQQQQQYSDKL